MNANEWFEAWIVGHKRRNPHKEFPPYEAGDRQEIYRGWIAALDAREIDEDLATAASLAMMASGGIYPEHHLARLIAEAGRIRATSRAVIEERRREEVRTEERRRDQLDERIRKLWAGADEADREDNREWIRANYPGMAMFPGFVESMARMRWADLVRASRRQGIGA